MGLRGSRRGWERPPPWSRDTGKSFKGRVSRVLRPLEISVEQSLGFKNFREFFSLGLSLLYIYKIAFLNLGVIIWLISVLSSSCLYRRNTSAGCYIFSTKSFKAAYLKITLLQLKWKVPETINYLKIILWMYKKSCGWKSVWRSHGICCGHLLLEKVAGSQVVPLSY